MTEDRDLIDDEVVPDGDVDEELEEDGDDSVAGPEDVRNADVGEPAYD